VSKGPLFGLDGVPEGLFAATAPSAWSEPLTPESFREAAEALLRSSDAPPLPRYIGHREWMRLVHLGTTFPEVSLGLREWVAMVSEDDADADRVMRDMLRDLPRVTSRA